MARPLRLEFAGALYHLTARGNARAKIISDDGDRRRFLELLGKEVAQQDWQLYAYCFSRKRASAYERFVQQGMKQESPWAKLKGQICLGDEAFLKHMERLAQGKPSANVPRAHTRPARPTAPTLTQAVLSTYGIKDEKTLCSRRHQREFSGVGLLAAAGGKFAVAGSRKARQCITIANIQDPARN